ncbi:hypothetical protein Tco_0991611 [Tanacetum coccineum]|uniref:Xylulose kinase-1 n=1 Tax=Tanacetum coccineum TaxID=301880 RepID=A0ABQ5F184_9ASTR
MVACLERTKENAEFHQIVDFLTTSSIHYALTVSPTIYASYIEQFWNTANSQTVNDVKQIHATIEMQTYNIKIIQEDIFTLMMRMNKIPVTELSSPQNTQSPRQALQKDTQLPQTSVPIPNVVDEAVFKERDDKDWRKGLDKENVSKQGRKSDKTKPMFKDSDFDVLDDAMENVEGVSIGDIFEDEMTTIADTLMAIRSARPRTTSVVIHNDKEEPRRVTPVPTVQSQDKEDSKGFAREKAAKQEAKDAALMNKKNVPKGRKDADDFASCKTSRTRKRTIFY